jgi:hypothetical protein
MGVYGAEAIIARVFSYTSNDMLKIFLMLFEHKEIRISFLSGMLSQNKKRP